VLVRGALSEMIKEKGTLYYCNVQKMYILLVKLIF